MRMKIPSQLFHRYHIYNVQNRTNISEYLPLPNLLLLYFISDVEEITCPFTQASILGIILDITLFLTSPF